MYINKANVKKRVKQIGFRCSPEFIDTLNVVVDRLIERSAEWTKPKKTIDREGLTSYLMHKGISI